MKKMTMIGILVFILLILSCYAAIKFSEPVEILLPEQEVLEEMAWATQKPKRFTDLEPFFFENYFPTQGLNFEREFVCESWEWNGKEEKLLVVCYWNVTVFHQEDGYNFNPSSGEMFYSPDNGEIWVEVESETQKDMISANIFQQGARFDWYPIKGYLYFKDKITLEGVKLEPDRLEWLELNYD